MKNPKNLGLPIDSGKETKGDFCSCVIRSFCLFFFLFLFAFFLSLFFLPPFSLGYSLNPKILSIIFTFLEVSLEKFLTLHRHYNGMNVR